MIRSIGTSYLVEKTFETLLPFPVEKVWAFHSSAEALRVLTPPGVRAVPLGRDLEVREGAIHRIRFSQFGLPMIWEARIEEVQPPTGFTDVAARSPFAYWKHRHNFVPTGHGTLLVDTVTYTPPGGFLAPFLEKIFIGREVDAMFAYRHQATRKALEQMEAV